MERAAKDDFIVVEDDYEFEMSFLTPPSPALKSLDNEGRVIHIGSFSKSLFPGLRLGYMVGNAGLHQARRGPCGPQCCATRRVMCSARLPPLCRLGHYDALIKRTATAFKRTAAHHVAGAFADHGLEIAWPAAATAGPAFWMRAPDGIDTRGIWRHGFCGKTAS